jgi:hypothetical protein
MMKQKLLALLLVSVMMASAVGAISISAPKVAAATPTHIDLYTTNAYPTKWTTYTIWGYLRDSNNNPVPYRSVAIWYRYSDQSSGTLLRTVTTNANGYFSTNDVDCKSLGYRAVFAGDSNYDASKNTNLVWVWFSRYITYMYLYSTNYAPNPYQQYEIYGHLRTGSTGYWSGSGVNGVSVDIWYRPSGATSGILLTTKTTSSTGLFYTYDSDWRLVGYRAVFSGDCTYWGTKNPTLVWVNAT